MKWNVTYNGKAVSMTVAGECWKQGDLRIITNSDLAAYLEGKQDFRVVKAEEPKPRTRRAAKPSTAKAKAKTKAKSTEPPEGDDADA